MWTMRYIASLLIFSGLSWAASPGIDIFSAKDVRNTADKLAGEGKPFASQELTRYGNPYTMLAYREATGSSELHEHEADFFVVETGQATLMTGGRLTNPKTQKPGEIRGTSIEGGKRHTVSAGDIVHIPAGIPHQLLIEKGKPFTYFVVKVTGQ
jgi:mannose-6-phosphate isomerase-like protein (cupin superfamily)